MSKYLSATCRTLPAIMISFVIVAHGAAALAGFEEELVKIRQGKDATEDVQLATDLLETEINAALPGLADDIALPLEGAIAKKLASLQLEFSQAHTSDYRVSCTALRLVELAMSIQALPSRPFEETAELRAEAAARYGKILEEFNEERAKRTLDERWAGYLQVQVPTLLEETQRNPLFPGYGILLSDAESAELKRLLLVTLSFAEVNSDSDLSPIEQAKRQMQAFPNLSEAFHKAWGHIIACERSRRIASAQRVTPPVLLSQAHRNFSEKAAEATKAETAAVIEHVRQEGERMQRENDPAEIERRQKKLEKLRQTLKQE